MQPRPRTSSRIRQERLASKEHLRAVFHVLELLELPLFQPNEQYKAADPSNGVLRWTHEQKAFTFDAKTGEAQWVGFKDDSPNTRVILNPDEGGPLYSGYQYLAQAHFPISLRRDELLPG